MAGSKQPSGTNATKDVIYIDVDDEITGIIDKVRGSGKKIVALVLPKRATVLQSIVNMKLLKRAADDAKKNLVLITGEAGLLPLAGNVGIHVAKSLNSKPEIPEAPARHDGKADTADEAETVIDNDDDAVDTSKTVGELSGTAAIADDSDEAIELDDEDPATGDKAKPAKGKNKKFKIPDFNKFRLLLVLGVVGLFLLGGGVYAAFFVMPKAKVTIKTDSTAVTSSLALALKTAPEAQLDAEQRIIPAQVQEVKKTLTQEVPATGQLNNGEKATGSVDMTAQDCSAPYSVSAVAAGTGVSTGGKTYATGEKATFSPTTFDFSTSCWSYKANGIDITALAGGTAYNMGTSTFAVAGRSDVSASGSASGGTDDIVKVATAADIDSAKQKISALDDKAVQEELRSALAGRGLFPVEVTYSVTTPETKSSVEPNAPAEVVTVTQTVSYTMLGIKEEDLEKVLDNDVADDIDTKKQSIISYGLNSATFALDSVNADGPTVSIHTTVVAGAQLDTNAIKQQVAGKKAGDAKELIMVNPGVTDVVVQYSPFWVSSIPKNTGKITIVIEEPQVVSRDASDEP